MSRCIHVYPFVARNHGGIPFSGVCPLYFMRGHSLVELTEHDDSAADIILHSMYSLELYIYALLH